jgi:acetyl-CoA C-acetyltransferase
MRRFITVARERMGFWNARQAAQRTAAIQHTAPPSARPAGAPYLVMHGRRGYRMGDGQLFDSVLRDGLNDAFSDAASGWHTEDLVEKFQVTREAQDRWAVRSQQRFGSAQAAGQFKAQIVPVEVPAKKGPTQFDKDEHNRPETTLETLARLKPAFWPNGTITAGNAPGLNDAAAAMVLADGSWAEKRGLPATARLVSYGIAAVEPGMFGLGPIPAFRQALQRAGWPHRVDEFGGKHRARRADRVTMGDSAAFDVDDVLGQSEFAGNHNGNGGKCLIDLDALDGADVPDGLTRGLVTLCIGGGQGIALAIEVLH